MILITGATGKLGSAVIETLLTKKPANEIAAFVRDEEKAADLKAKGIRIQVGDYDNIPSLESAMKGVKKVLLISGGNAPNIVEQHKNVIDAAKKTGVICFAYTGRALKDRSTLNSKFMDTHFQTDDIIMESEMNYMLFRNILYMDSLLFALGTDVIEKGINLPTGDGKVAFALRSEMGEAIANVLLEEGCDNKIYNFTGAKSYSYEDIASTLSELTGKTVQYNQVKPEMFVERLTERGIPEQIAHHVLDSMLDIKNGQENVVTTDLENKLGRKPATLEEGLKILFRL